MKTNSDTKKRIIDVDHDGPALYEETELSRVGRRSGRARLPSLFDQRADDDPYGELIVEEE